MYINKAHRLTLANDTQKALFLFEIQGQLSDGQWENTQPQDHWEIWCGLDISTVLVDADVTKQGRNFIPCKDGYALTSLIQWTGDRMLKIAKLAKVLPLEIVELIENSYDDNMELHPWVDDVEVDLTLAQFQIAKWALGNLDYDEADLRKDLAGIRKAMKTFVATK